jgi:hypothetical protein
VVVVGMQPAAAGTVETAVPLVLAVVVAAPANQPPVLVSSPDPEATAVPAS